MAKPKIIFQEGFYCFYFTKYHNQLVNVSILGTKHKIYCPGSRHQVIEPNPPPWNMLQNEQQDRVILLSTNCMKLKKCCDVITGSGTKNPENRLSKEKEAAASIVATM